MRPWLWMTIGAGAALLAVLLVLASAVPLSSETMRRSVVASLSERLDADVELKGLNLRVVPRFHAEGVGLTIRHKRRPDVLPLISVRALTIDADLPGLMRRHVARVTLEGLDIEVPPGSPADREPKPHRRATAGAKDIVIDDLVSSNASLVVIPREEGKLPNVWAIHDLRMQSVGYDRAMPFDAVLTNAIPPGEISTRGIFGPWRAGDPGATPVEGTFTFARANLDVFRGISGILAAHGEFGGALGRLSVHGETDTPDFTLDISGHPVPLHTDYHATVDGTNGDTYLDLISASFLHTSLTAKGSVVDSPDKSGRTVTLDVSMDEGRVEDVLRLASRADAPMMGGLRMTTRLVLPPGQHDVAEKLRLDGEFSIAQARFTEIDVQRKINDLSQRSRGNPEAMNPQRVVSDFNGRFSLANAVLTLRRLTFSMPGARVRLAGTYSLRPEILDFRGTLYMDAKVSETQSGVKRMLLKAIDPLFNADGGGSAIPIRIRGHRRDPGFGLDTGRMFKR